MLTDNSRAPLLIRLTHLRALRVWGPDAAFAENSFLYSPYASKFSLRIKSCNEYVACESAVAESRE